ncbi:MAG TPA: PepSY-like domain-containing protein, partial [Draconibacterium sp.]|nr:PepSY-like domain-containing protein [Draconibacterium sp.]
SATKVKWGMEDETEWEAEFKMDGKEMSASFDKEGKWINTEAKLTEKDLPANVLKAVQTAYAGWKIESVESYETPEMKGYELGVEKGKEELEILVTADGKITVKKESEEGEDEKDEK